MPEPEPWTRQEGLSWFFFEKKNQKTSLTYPFSASSRFSGRDGIGVCRGTHDLNGDWTVAGRRSTIG
jgi:hypothetical protein